MIGLVQRVKHARVEVDSQSIGAINHGMLILLGVEKTDDQQIAEKLADKLLKMRIFNDENGKMNLNLQQSGGELLVVSQFTLVADTQKGNRPGFSQAAGAEQGNALYEYFVTCCQQHGLHCATGKFGADMQVTLCNDGPVTFHVQVN